MKLYISAQYNAISFRLAEELHLKITPSNIRRLPMSASTYRIVSMNRVYKKFRLQQLKLQKTALKKRSNYIVEFRLR